MTIPLPLAGEVESATADRGRAGAGEALASPARFPLTPALSRKREREAYCVGHFPSAM